MFIEMFAVFACSPATEEEHMRQIVVTIEAPPDVSIRIVRKEAPSRLRLSPRSRVGKPVTAFLIAFSASSKDGASAPADAVRDHFAAHYPSRGKSPKSREETVARAWRRALTLVEEDFTVERAGGVEVLRRLDEPPTSKPPTPPGSGKATATGPSIGATRGARTPRSGSGG